MCPNKSTASLPYEGADGTACPGLTTDNLLSVFRWANRSVSGGASLSVFASLRDPAVTQTRRFFPSGDLLARPPFGKFLDPSRQTLPIVKSGARPHFSTENQASKIKFYHVTWCVDFTPPLEIVLIVRQVVIAITLTPVRHKRHTQCLTSAPNFRGSADPHLWPGLREPLCKILGTPMPLQLVCSRPPTTDQIPRVNRSGAPRPADPAPRPAFSVSLLASVCGECVRARLNQSRSPARGGASSVCACHIDLRRSNRCRRLAPAAAAAGTAVTAAGTRPPLLANQLVLPSTTPTRPEVVRFQLTETEILWRHR